MLSAPGRFSATRKLRRPRRAWTLAAASRHSRDSPRPARPRHRRPQPLPASPLAPAPRRQPPGASAPMRRVAPPGMAPRAKVLPSPDLCIGPTATAPLVAVPPLARRPVCRDCVAVVCACEFTPGSRCGTCGAAPLHAVCLCRGRSAPCSGSTASMSRWSAGDVVQTAAKGHSRPVKIGEPRITVCGWRCVDETEHRRVLGALGAAHRWRPPDIFRAEVRRSLPHAGKARCVGHRPLRRRSGCGPVAAGSVALRAPSFARSGWALCRFPSSRVGPRLGRTLARFGPVGTGG